MDIARFARQTDLGPPTWRKAIWRTYIVAYTATDIRQSDVAINTRADIWRTYIATYTATDI